MKKVGCRFELDGTGCSKVWVCVITDQEAVTETQTHRMTGWSKGDALHEMNKRLNLFGYEAVPET